MRLTAYAMLVACLVCELQFLPAHGTRVPVVPAQVYWLAFAMTTIFFGYWILNDPVTLFRITTGAALVLAGVAQTSARRT